jgi:hypothetical protein
MELNAVNGILDGLHARDIIEPRISVVVPRENPKDFVEVIFGHGFVGEALVMEVGGEALGRE